MSRDDRSVCTCLRSKGMYVDAPRDPEVPETSAGCFWCRHTMTLLGPDGGVAEPAACRPGRSCYQRS